MERALYVIPHHLNMDILTEFFSIGILLKKRILVLRFLACWFAGISLWSFADDAPIAGCICVALVLWVLLIPIALKKKGQSYYQKDKNILKERTLFLFDDHFVVETVVGSAKSEYVKLHKVVVTQIAVYMYYSPISAVCVPKEAFTKESLEFLLYKTKNKIRNAK